MEQEFCKYCFEPVLIKSLDRDNNIECTIETYCEYCDLTYIKKVQCNDILDDGLLDSEYYDVLY
jgi:hypothetical protein